MSSFRSTRSSSGGTTASKSPETRNFRGKMKSAKKYKNLSPVSMFSNKNRKNSELQTPATTSATPMPTSPVSTVTYDPNKSNRSFRQTYYYDEETLNDFYKTSENISKNVISSSFRMSTMDPPIPKIIPTNKFFIDAPILNTIPTSSVNNIHNIQNEIEKLINYINNIYIKKSEDRGDDSRGIKGLKNLIKIESPFLYEFNYYLFMSTLMEYKVNRSNFIKLSNLFYNFYSKMLSNLQPIAYIIVNVNYSATSNLSHLLLNFINNCANSFESLINDVLDKRKQLPAEYYADDKNDAYFNHIQTRQNNLNIKFNVELTALRDTIFQKYTADNDINDDNKYKVSKNKDLRCQLIEISPHIQYVNCKLNY
ncbi:hypothetical protein ManeNPV_00040 [Malacosoma neustria nucleopolyhedrovirus]|uniref:hypothetical protein n=1 Tax=Malacosoma neustria nuclear polyhedrosis virus TaxID=38012 RepID=UPI000E358472|nr:hypothetical protein ManeNPV_00040 [Malacosoma neustria nucleopolyhedrovirus]AUF81568.1 hypothetical protein ManeNPV_00040 [Malacosoma neustria nucleopolyhedrovirus]